MRLSSCRVFVLVIVLASIGWGQTARTGGAGLMEPVRDVQTGALAEYQPILGKQWGTWYLRETGKAAVGGAVFSAVWGTAWGTPREYPATWEHFGKRWGLSASGTAIGNGLEAGFGSIWGEDPRYFRIDAPLKGNFRTKAKNIVVSTFLATNHQGERMPAYARYIGLSGTNFLQMAWRPESQSSVGDAFVRMGYGFLSRMGANAFEEFLPDVRNMMSRKKGPKDSPATESNPR